MMSESNRVNLSLIPPRRGWILDRNGQPIASNRADFRVDIIPDRLIDKDKTLAELATILQLSPIDMQDIKDKLDKARGFQPVAAGEHLSADLYAAVSVRQPDLPGVVPQRSFSRFIPPGHAWAIWWAMSAPPMRRITPRSTIPAHHAGVQDRQGRAGKAFRRGTARHAGRAPVGSHRGRQDRARSGHARGRSRQAHPSHHLGGLAGLCRAAHRARTAAPVVVMDCHRRYSRDGLDAQLRSQQLSDGIGGMEWKMLSEDDHVPLRNKILRGLYPPGSTVKPTVALAFLEAGLDPHESVNCNGGLQVGNRVFHCWQHHGHGPTNMWKGIYQSCDVYFYYFAQKIGMDKIARMMRRMGYGGIRPALPAQSLAPCPTRRGSCGSTTRNGRSMTR
jgi:penicillin-binding protein 2